MARRKQTLARSKQQKLQCRKQRDRKTRGSTSVVKMSRKMVERLDFAYHLIHNGDYAEAEETLQKLDSGSTSCPQVAEALMFLYQSTQDHERCCAAAKRLAVLHPRDAEAHIMYAQESMFCGRATIARLGYERFIDRWPEHQHITKAKTALEILVPETEDRIKAFGFPKECALEWLAIHEESLALLQNGDYSGCAAKCRELLAKVPTFASARNNLAIAYFQSAHQSDAVAVLEETLELFPDNRFAEAALAKLYFLTGRTEDAQRVADQIVAGPPAYQDAFVATLETLAILGRDEDVVNLAEGATADQIMDDRAQGVRHHYLAYAKCRLGDENAAKVHWKKCAKLYPQLSEARENLLDLESGGGHAPWPAAFGKWIPKDTMDEVVRRISDKKEVLLTRYPGMAVLIPALLERGDPTGREVAKMLAMAHGSPQMLDALKDFALGMRGPDSMRFEVLQFLKEKGAIDAGPHRVYSRGAWTEIELLAWEIYDEPVNVPTSPRVLERIENGIEAMHALDYDSAEVCFEEALEAEPNNCTAAYNLCASWLQRRGNALKQKAQTRLEQLHRDFPDYPFAAIALAQCAGMDRDFQKARDLLAPIYKAKRIHISEAKALFTAQTQLALEERDLDGAERAYQFLCQISNADDSSMRMLRKRIDKASRKSGLRALFSRF